MNVQENTSLKKMNTMGLPVSTRYFTAVSHLEELREALQFKKDRNLPLMLLGGGSNVLFTKDFPGITVKVEFRGIEVLEETDDEVVVKCGAGEVWHDFVLYALGKNWGGVENLSLIPGTVGAAPMQNIGAYGVEIKEVFHSLEALNIKTLKLEAFDASKCEFKYRDSFFKRAGKGQYVITSVTFRLTKEDHQLKTSYGAISETLQERGISNPSIKDVSDAVIAIRSSKLPDPAVLGNAGSFFKNPEISNDLFEKVKQIDPNVVAYKIGDRRTKLAAGYLIESCGWKGKKLGMAGVHEKQALVLVNYGEASGQEIFELSEKIQQSVYKKYGISLEREVNIIS